MPIRNNIKDGKGFIGLEHWLQEKQRGEPGRRMVDKFVAFPYYSLLLPWMWEGHICGLVWQRNAITERTRFQIYLSFINEKLL